MSNNNLHALSIQQNRKIQKSKLKIKTFDTHDTFNTFPTVLDKKAQIHDHK
jgi:hypothetical protein